MAARGFQGDTLTTVFMLAAGVLVWNKLSNTVDKVGKNLEFGQNSGGIFQNETTEEINVYESEVKNWSANWATLGAAGKTKCTNIANKLYVEVKNNFGYSSNIDEDYMINLCKPLNANELRAVAILFGVKDINNFAGLTSWSGHIFHLFDTVLTDTMFGGNDLTNMKTVWAKSGLWI